MENDSENSAEIPKLPRDLALIPVGFSVTENFTNSDMSIESTQEWIFGKKLYGSNYEFYKKNDDSNIFEVRVANDNE